MSQLNRPFGGPFGGSQQQNSNGQQPFGTQPFNGISQPFSQLNGQPQAQQSQMQDEPQMNIINEMHLLNNEMNMHLNFSGVIECGECEDEDTLRIEYSIKYDSKNWKINQDNNKEEEPSGISQLSTSHNLHSRNIVWNFPFECSFATTNLYGWPQLVVRLSGPDFLGRTVAKGYGSVHIPSRPGYHERVIRIFKPIPTSGFTGFLGYMLGNTAELKNFDKVISSGEGREVTRVRSVGYVKVKFHITLVNFEKFGYI